ncbi:uncharacterized protein L969DRAFT_106104 [Mixia osmundae IAM 14324]|uniref:Srp40 C-terminal domain-containing protein n=1 Tax=Mixia osmundae (strain CBS 9802 / IAM 14324 / JCM 22182 / KY 12970) TaxID=764103 RepID=G7E4F2_MIXOS|nr:uncharacterized protein L969DRAFT_106104 [Mixia osmundae IAM 14324]KEI36270.1 hypothetical protein L969DRAFT_106104 [Mixia osmundae IAM 14324]GAA97712.1 hypothetical protein E5Q_04391 [Mixia osmundae IAM 14324]
MDDQVIANACYLLQAFLLHAGFSKTERALRRELIKTRKSVKRLDKKLTPTVQQEGGELFVQLLRDVAPAVKSLKSYRPLSIVPVLPQAAQALAGKSTLGSPQASTSTQALAPAQSVQTNGTDTAAASDKRKKVKAPRSTDKPAKMRQGSKKAAEHPIVEQVVVHEMEVESAVAPAAALSHVHPDRLKTIAPQAAAAIAAAQSSRSASPLATVTTIELDDSAPATKNGKAAKKVNTPFRRIRAEEITVDPRLADNSFAAKGGAANTDYGHKAAQDLIVTRGAGFRKEKNKKKRGSYRGGEITMESHSIKFD